MDRAAIRSEIELSLGRTTRLFLRVDATMNGSMSRIEFNDQISSIPLSHRSADRANGERRSHLIQKDSRRLGQSTQALTTIDLGQRIVVASHPNVQRRHEEDADDQVSDQSANDHDSERTL
jgi:hypothetical protein